MVVLRMAQCHNGLGWGTTASALLTLAHHNAPRALQASVALMGCTVYAFDPSLTRKPGTILSARPPLVDLSNPQHDYRSSSALVNEVKHSNFTACTLASALLEVFASTIWCGVMVP